MNKIISIIFLIFISLNIGFSYDCPYGIIEDPFPGLCTLYVDEDKDGNCDLAIGENEETHDVITGTELKTKTVGAVAVLYKIDSHDYSHALSDYYNTKIEPWDHFQRLHDNLGIEPSIAKDIAVQVSLGTYQENEEVKNEVIVENEKVVLPKYPLLIVSLFTILIYFFTYSAAKAKLITMIRHRKIWNIILTISFLMVGVLGILLVIRINYQIMFDFPFNILYWHVISGIVMTIISIFHAFWHIPYYKKILK